MIATLMGAALAAAQPAPVAHSPAHPATAAPTGHEQHQAMKEKCCCCEQMMKGGHDKHAPSHKPHRGR